MNVLMFGWELPPDISGGLGTACAGLLEGLAQDAAVSVTFVLPRVSTAQNIPGIRLLDLNVAVKSSDQQHNPPFTSGPYGYAIKNEVTAYTSSAVLMVEHYPPFDIIHAHDWLTFNAGVRIKKLSGKKLVVHVHSTEYDRTDGLIDVTVFEVEQQGMMQADHIIAVSQYTKLLIVEKYGIAPDKVEVIHNALPLSAAVAPISQPRSAQTVSFIGRVTVQKGPEYFVDAAYKIHQRMPEVRFVMAGAGNLLPLMKSLVKSMGLHSCFTFPGFLSATGVHELLSCSDIFVMPSISEPFGIGALEAIRAGVPVVLSQHCGLTALLRNVVTVPPADTDAMADVCLALLEQPAQARRMASAAMEELAQFSWMSSARQLGDLYQRVMAPEPLTTC